jgi:hypothetical protein
MPPTTASTTASSQAQKRGSDSRAPARSSRYASQELLPAPQTHDLLAGPSIDERIRLRAYDLYERRGRTDGQALDDWLGAESELGGH